jgi:hypothetical protein
MAMKLRFIPHLLRIYLKKLKGSKRRKVGKGGKQFRSWVENQSNKNTKITIKNNVGEKFSKVTLYLYKFTYISYDLLDLTL